VDDPPPPHVQKLWQLSWKSLCHQGSFHTPLILSTLFPSNRV
jgi:hypothetical protein